MASEGSQSIPLPDLYVFDKIDRIREEERIRWAVRNLCGKASRGRHPAAESVGEEGEEELSGEQRGSFWQRDALDEFCYLYDLAADLERWF